MPNDNRAADTEARNQYLGIIDDPFKGRGDANSNLIRDKIWSWFTDDFCTRLSKNAGFLIIMTRWHLDDLLGRLLRQSDREVRVLRYPALAEEDENHWLSDWQLTNEGWLPIWRHIRRSKGAALFPELKHKRFLLEQRELLPQSSWESLYQQNPILVGGGQLPIEKLQVLHFSIARISFHRCGIGTKAGRTAKMRIPPAC